MSIMLATMTKKHIAGSLRKPAVDGVETLERMKHWPSLRRTWINQKVRIYSGEHALYWRAEGAGYTQNRKEAGLYEFEDAWDRVSHCGPEKKIRFILAI